MNNKLKSGSAKGVIIPVGLHGGMSEEAVREVYAEDKINHPDHYTKYSVEVIEITRYLPFCLGNVVKYVLRAPYKGGVEDCDKARWYLGRCKREPVWLPVDNFDRLRDNTQLLQKELEQGSDVEKIQAECLTCLWYAIVGEPSQLEYPIEKLRRRLMGFPDEASYQFWLGYTQGKNK